MNTTTPTHEIDSFISSKDDSMVYFSSNKKVLESHSNDFKVSLGNLDDEMNCQHIFSL